ncbi:MAG: hypothetical protein DI585_03075 [Pseudomonas fluorescens]|nr:MAG: hypothetical protein DI585_03075 [Pseudomonas fluorescens]
MAVFDLALGGVKVELDDHTFDWLSATQPVRKVPVAEVAPVEEVGEVVPLRPLPPPLTADSMLTSEMRPPVKPKMVAPEIPAEIWSEGEEGGVVLVVQGGMPDDRCVALAHAMLAAVGLGDSPVAWVGFAGKPSKDEMFAAIQAKAANQVLVLGQIPLGVLVGRNLGVEGWHAAASQTLEGWDGAVGVTYPLDLLLKQPLFKRLAWHHLLAWGEGA